MGKYVVILNFSLNNSQYLEIRCSCFKWILPRIESVNDERLDVDVTMIRTKRNGREEGIMGTVI